MFLSHRNFIFFGLISVLSASSLAMDKPEEDVFDIVKKEHAASISNTTKQKKPEIAAEIEKNGKPRERTWEDMVKQEYEEQISPPYDETTEIAFFSKICDLLKDSKYFSKTSNHLQIDAATREDLKLLHGANQNSKDCLANKLNQTVTFAGQAALCSQLVRPHAAFECLEAKKSKVERLVQLHAKKSIPNFATLQNHLKNAASGESAFLSFFNPVDPFEFELESKKTQLPFANKFALIKKIQNWANNNEIYLSWQEACPALMTAVSVGIGALTKKKTFLDFCKIISGPNRFKLSEYKSFVESIGFQATKQEDDKLNYALKLIFPEKFVEFLGIGIAAQNALQQINSIPSTKKTMANSLVTIKYMRKKLHHASKMIRAFKDSQHTLQQLSSFFKGKTLVDLNLPQTPEGKETLELLNTSTFNEDHDGLWLVHWGRVKLAYKRLCETKNQFRPAYAALAELDSLMSSARLIIDNPAPLIRGSTQKAPYTLPTFIAGSQAPSLKATDCWNPFIKDGTQCVLNNVELSSDGKKILVISGPNGKGKTVYMAMAMYAAIMSQALGVAPAQSFSQTPYNHLITFMRTETDTSRGQSLFRNTCSRAKVFKETILRQPGFKICAMDEPFGGATKHSLAQSAADEFVKLIGTTPNINGIVTTHFKALTRLPTAYPTYFMNLKPTDDLRVEPGIGYCEKEEAGLQILQEELGEEFANVVKKNMQYQTVHDYWEQQSSLDEVVRKARQEYLTLRQHAGTPILDGIITNLTNPELRALWEQNVNNPSINEIHTIINRLRDVRFDIFFDLLERVAFITQLAPQTQQETFKSLMLDIMAHCADATATGHSAPWLERIRQIEAGIAQEQERRVKLQQEINVLQYIRNNQPLQKQLQGERQELSAMRKQKEDKLADLQSIQAELNLMQRLRRLQFTIGQQQQELSHEVSNVRQQLQLIQKNSLSNSHT